MFEFDAKRFGANYGEPLDTLGEVAASSLDHLTAFDGL